MVLIKISRERNFRAHFDDGLFGSQVFFKKGDGVGNVRQNFARHVVVDAFLIFHNFNIFRFLVVKDIPLFIALNFGGQQEIIRAAQKLAEHVANGDMKPEDIDRKAFESELYTAGLPDVDFLIRTSGEMRLSNFLLYQLAYAEFYQTDTLWPDFDRHAYDEALLAYAKRNRRFGGV